MINTKLSAKIFDDLINGKIINAQLIGQDEMPYENPLFTEIMTNLDEYVLHFERCGKVLSKSSSFFVLQEELPTKTDVTMKVCLLLLTLGKFMNVKGWSIDKLMDSNGGLTANEIKEIESIDEVCATESLNKAGIKGDMTSAVNRILVERGIMIIKPASKKYVLSNAGQAFFLDIFKNFKESAI